MIRTLFVATAFCVLVAEIASAQTTEIKIGYLRQGEARTAISLLDIPAPNDGVAGAELAIDDNNTTGKFLNQHFALEAIDLKDEDDPAAAVGTVSIIFWSKLQASNLSNARTIVRRGMRQHPRSAISSKRCCQMYC